MKDALQLQRDAEASGKKCDHPDIEKEYHLGMQSGDYVCTSCGETFGEATYNKKRIEKQCGTCQRPLGSKDVQLIQYLINSGATRFVVESILGHTNEAASVLKQNGFVKVGSCPEDEHRSQDLAMDPNNPVPTLSRTIERNIWEKK